MFVYACQDGPLVSVEKAVEAEEARKRGDDEKVKRLIMVAGL